MTNEVDWQQRYLQHDTPWDRGCCHPLTYSAIPHFMDGDIFVPGCGRGWDARALRDHTNSLIIGADLSEAAIADARKLHGEDRMLWLLADLFSHEMQQRPQVQNIWEHTCFCALPPSMRRTYVACLARILATDGILCGVFFTHMDDGNQGPPWNCPPTELLQLFQLYFTIIRNELASESFPGREGEESFIVMQRNSQPVQ